MNKKIFGISIVIVFVAVVVYFVAGINLDLKYRIHENVAINIGESYNMSDIKAITNEVFGKATIKLEQSGLYKDGLIISVADTTGEQISTLKNKLNEKYNITQTIRVKIGEEYTVEDVQAIAKEVFGKDDIKVEKEQDNTAYATIDVNLITEQERDALNSKINEKYNLSNEASSISVSNIITVSNIPRVRIIDMAKQYLVYTLIATALVLVYFVIRYNKLGIKKIIIEFFATVILAEVLFTSIITIIRLPINKLFIIALFAIYMLMLAYINGKYISQAEKIKKNN